MEENRIQELLHEKMKNGIEDRIKFNPLLPDNVKNYLFEIDFDLNSES